MSMWRKTIQENIEAIQTYKKAFKEGKGWEDVGQKALIRARGGSDTSGSYDLYWVGFVWNLYLGIGIGKSIENLGKSIETGLKTEILDFLEIVYQQDKPINEAWQTVKDYLVKHSEILFGNEKIKESLENIDKMEVSAIPDMVDRIPVGEDGHLKVEDRKKTPITRMLYYIPVPNQTILLALRIFQTYFFLKTGFNLFSGKKTTPWIDWQISGFLINSIEGAPYMKFEQAFIDKKGKSLLTGDYKYLNLSWLAEELLKILPEVEKPDFSAIWEQVKRTERFPVDKWLDKHKQLILPFPKEVNRVSVEELKSGERAMTYRVEALLEKTDIVFTLPKGANPPSFNRYMASVLFSMMPFAMVQKTLNPYIKKEHQYKLLGEKPHYYKWVDDILKTLTTGYWDYENKKKGKEYRRSIGHIVNKVEFFGKGRGSYYKAEINPTITQSLMAIIEGKKGKEIPRFTMYPIQALTQKPTRKTRAGESVLRYRGFKRTYGLQIRTFLTTRMGIKAEEIKYTSLQRLMETVESGLKEIEKEDFDWQLDQESFTLPKAFIRTETIRSKGFSCILQKYKDYKKEPALLNALIKKGLPAKLHIKDFLKWKLVFMDTKKHKKTKERQGAEILKSMGINPQELNEIWEREEDELLDKLTEWCCIPEFKTRKSPDEVRKQLRNSMKTLGITIIKELVEETWSMENPHPQFFWKRIKEEISKIK